MPQDCELGSNLGSNTRLKWDIFFYQQWLSIISHISQLKRSGEKSSTSYWAIHQSNSCMDVVSTWCLAVRQSHCRCWIKITKTKQKTNKQIHKHTNTHVQWYPASHEVLPTLHLSHCSINICPMNDQSFTMLSANVFNKSMQPMNSTSTCLYALGHSA